MTSFIRLNFVPFFLAVILVFTIVPFVESAGRIYARQGPAIAWYGAKVITPTVTPGGTLEIAYDVRVNRQCPSDLRGFLVGPDGSVPVRFPVIAGGYVKPSGKREVVHVTRQIPLKSDPGLAPFKPGEYTYRAAATRYCTDGVEDDDAIPDAKFRLVLN